MNWESVTSGDNRNSRCYEMFASVDLFTLTLNSLASQALSEMYGGDNYDLELLISSCGQYIGVKAVMATRVKLNPQKAITAKPIYHIIKKANGTSATSKLRYKLEQKDEMLVFNVNRN